MLLVLHTLPRKACDFVGRRDWELFRFLSFFEKKSFWGELFRQLVSHAVSSIVDVAVATAAVASVAVR